MYGAFQPTHLLLILIIVLIIFGPGKMKGIGKSLGETIHSFKSEVNKEDQVEKTDTKNA